MDRGDQAEVRLGLAAVEQRRKIRAGVPDYFLGVFTCFGFRFSRPRLSLLTPAVCHESLNLHPTISSWLRESAAQWVSDRGSN